MNNKREIFMNKKTLAILIRALIVLAVVIISAILVYYFFKLFYPFIIGTVIVMLINLIIKFLEKKSRFPRLIAVLKNLFLFFTFFVFRIMLLFILFFSYFSYFII